MTNPIRRAIDAERSQAAVAETVRKAFEAKRSHEAADAALGYGTRKITSGAEVALVRDLMGQALAYQMGGPEPDNDAASRFIDMPFGEQVALLMSIRGQRVTGRAAILSRAITTGDVSELLTGAGNRVLRKSFESYRGGLLSVCGRAPSRDFRDVKLIQVDGDLALQEVPDGASYSRGYLKSSAETYAISTFGKIISISHTLMVDDDIGAFANLADRLGQAAAEFCSGKLAALLEANGNLSDGVAVFAAGHANLGSAGALSETTLGELMKLMRSQKGLGGERISVVPHALVVPAALEITARKLVASITPGGDAPPLVVVVEPRLASATAHYLLAAPEAGMGLSATFPDGSEAPTFELAPRPGFLGLQGKVRMDFGCGIADYRGLAKNAGA